MFLNQSDIKLNFCFLFYLIFMILNQAKDFGISNHFYQSNRYYDPKLSQFIGPDTMVPNPIKSQALNRYSYVYNNPLNYRDPSGHVPVGPDWLDRIISGFFGNRSKPPPSGYTGSIGGHSHAADMSRRAWDSQRLNSNTVKLAAGAAVAAREVEIKTGVSLLAGSGDLFYYSDPQTYVAAAHEGEFHPPSEVLFAVVDLDLAQEPGYKLPYYGSIAAGAGLIIVPAAQALKYRLSPKLVPVPRPQPSSPQPGNRRPPRLGEPGYPPAFAGASPGPLDFLHDLPLSPGTKVSITPIRLGGAPNLRFDIAVPTGRVEGGSPLVNPRHINIRLSPGQQPEVTDYGDQGEIPLKNWLDSIRDRGDLSLVPAIEGFPIKFERPNIYTINSKGGLTPDGPVDTDIESFLNDLGN